MRGRVRFLGIDHADVPGPARAFLRWYRINYPQLVDPDGVVAGRLGLPGIPVTLALEAGGRIRYRRIGVVDNQQVTDAVAAIAPASGRSARDGSGR